MLLFLAKAVRKCYVYLFFLKSINQSMKGQKSFIPFPYLTSVHNVTIYEWFCMPKISCVFFLTVGADVVNDIPSTYNSCLVYVLALSWMQPFLLMSRHLLPTSVPATFQSSALHRWQFKNPSVISRCLTTPRDDAYFSQAKVCTWHLVVGFQIIMVYTLQCWTAQLRESAGNCI